MLCVQKSRLLPRHARGKGGVMESSWVIKAIEDAAMARALYNLHTTGSGIIVLGLNAGQILQLMEFYRNNTGKEPRDLPRFPATEKARSE